MVDLYVVYIMMVLYVMIPNIYGIKEEVHGYFQNYIKYQEGFSTQLKVESKNFTGIEKDLLGSGVPSGMEIIDRATYTP